MLNFLRKYKTLIVIILTVAVINGYKFYTKGIEPSKITLTELEQLVTEKHIAVAKISITATQAEFTLTLNDGKVRNVFVPVQSAQTYINKLSDVGTVIDVTEGPLTLWGHIKNIFIYIFVSIIILGVLNAIIRKKDKENDDEEDKKPSFLSLDIGINIPKPQTSTVKFKDVAGIDEIREQVEQIVAFLKEPKKLTRLGARPPRGTLLVGPGGTGKTMLAKAVAGEAGVPFYAISASKVDGAFVGDGSQFFQKVFKAAKKRAPSIIFIDEIDAVGKKRNAHESKWSAQSLNQLLTEMDGFNDSSGVIVLAATNRPDDLDPALRRPGRFDREIEMRLPSAYGRMEILMVTAKNRNIPLAEDVDLMLLARNLPGHTGAEIVNILNEATIHATLHNRDKVTMDDFEYAREKEVMGIESPITMSPEERRITAVHEAGHAVVALAYADDLDPVYKATILPRGRALGMVTLIPNEDKMHINKRQLYAKLAVTFGGRMAEELTAKDESEVTAGAASDLQKITTIATKMIMEWGFGKSKYRAFRTEADSFTGETKMHDVSARQREELDEEINALIQTVEANVRSILKSNSDVLNDLAQELFEKETLSGSHLRETYQPRIRKPKPLATVAE